MRVFFVATVALALPAATAHAAPAAAPRLSPPPPPKYAAADRLEPARPGRVKLGGFLGQRLDACMSARVAVQEIEAVVKPYRDKREVGDGDWRCEYWGKWYTSLALGCAYQPTPGHLAVLQEGCRALVATAAPDGYLGTRGPEHRLKGWDVWGRKYALLGLLAYYDLTGDASALAAARRHTESLMAEVGPGKANLAEVGYAAWKGLPPSSILEPVVLLYQRTGDARYLEFARYIVGQWDHPNKLTPTGLRLVDDALAGKPPTQIGAPKAYEMMSCYEGLCELYRATGERRYLDACVKLVEGIRRDEITVIGSGSSGELWFGGRRKQTGVVNHPMETCVTATWMKLCNQLLRLTGDASYADDLETSLYNALLGAMMPDGRWWSYFTSLMGERLPSYQQHKDVGLSCCVVNGPRALLLAPFWSVMRSAEGPVVNLYAPGEVETTTPLGRRLVLAQETDYPLTGEVRVTVRPERPEEFTLALRIPAWSAKTTLQVNGKPAGAQPGGYAQIRRRWLSGDRVTLSLDMRGRLLDAPDGSGQIAVARGPIVLALDNRLAPPIPDERAVIDRSAAPYVALKPNPEAARKHGVWMAFDARFTLGGMPRTTTLCDFASAGNAWSEKNVYRTWFPQPLDRAGAYLTGVTWRHLTHGGERPVAPPDQSALLKSPNLALAAKGAVATADSEYAKEAPCARRAIDGVASGEGDFEGRRWHSSVETPHPHWIQVKLPRAATLGRVVVRFADPKGYPVRFEGQAIPEGKREWQTLFRKEGNREARSVEITVAPVRTDTFRLLIHESANAQFPNAAQVSEIELYPPESGGR